MPSANNHFSKTANLHSSAAENDSSVFILHALADHVSSKPCHFIQSMTASVTILSEAFVESNAALNDAMNARAVSKFCQLHCHHK